MLAIRRAPRIRTVLAAILVVLLLIWLTVNAYKTPSQFYNLFLIGLTNGAVYGLVALGYSLVYGILELINFAHGDVFMLGGMMSATVLTGVFHLGNNPSAATLWPAILATIAIAIVFCAAVNVTVERIAYRPLRHAPRLAPLITAIAASFILQNIGLKWKGPGYTTVPPLLPHGTVFSVAGVTYTWNKLIVVLITVPVIT